MIKDFIKQKTVFNTDKFEIGKAYAVYMKDDRDLIHHDMILKRKTTICYISHIMAREIICM